MRPFLFAIALLASSVAALKSGIYADDGTSVIQPPGYVEVRPEGVDRRAEPVVPTSTERFSNAERLRRHLPLLPPTRRSGPLAPRASCVPLGGGRGKIAVRNLDNNNLLGYVRKTYDGQNSYTYGASENALEVELASTSGGVFEIIALNGPDAAHPLFGAVGGSGGYNFNSDNLGYAYLSGTGHTPANSPPSFSAGHSIQSLGYNAPAESTIWSVDCFTQQLSAQWTNVDGSQPSTSLFYDASVDFLGLVGDFNKFVSTFPDEGAIRVSFQFIAN